jgi:hypothetical protein
MFPLFNDAFSTSKVTKLEDGYEWWIGRLWKRSWPVQGTIPALARSTMENHKKRWSGQTVFKLRAESKSSIYEVGMPAIHPWPCDDIIYMKHGFQNVLYFIIQFLIVVR